ncbi:MAG: hypothetical protein ACLRYE_09935 [Gemmiger formicilis]|uniref:hypothetical protein n=1 Tax=Gemmiger formicilis TaxID=745368 RepID=UPI00399F5017
MKGKCLNLRSEIIRAGFTCYNVAEAIGIFPASIVAEDERIFALFGRGNRTHRKVVEYQ